MFAPSQVQNLWCEELKNLLLDADDMLQEAQRRKDPQWWRYADHRDDLVDVLLAVIEQVGAAPR